MPHTCSTSRINACSSFFVPCRTIKGATRCLVEQAGATRERTPSRSLAATCICGSVTVICPSCSSSRRAFTRSPRKNENPMALECEDLSELTDLAERELAELRVLPKAEGVT